MRWRRAARERSEPRPFAVVELVAEFMYHGRVWTVGCLTAEAAEASFRRRVARNLAASGNPGAVIAFRREGRQPICWTDEVLDAKGALEYFGC